MFGYVFIISIFKQFHPYFRKHISNVLDHHEYVLLSAVMIFCIILMYIVYLVLISKTTSFSTMTANMSELHWTEVCVVFLLSSFTVISGLVMFELDKNHNTPLMNSIFIKALSTISVICVGVFVFEEIYQIHQLIGMSLIFIGIFLASQEKLSTHLPFLK